MSVKGFLLLFLIMYLTLIPVSAEEEPLDINITFPAFYEVNISGALAKNIGVAGLEYPVTVYVSSADKEMNLTNRSLEVIFNYDEFNPRNLPIFSYEEHFDRNVTFPIHFNLADPNLTLAECGCFQFKISFLKPGSYFVEWFEIVENTKMLGKGMRIQIVEPYEWENIIKQSQLIDAEKRSAGASENAIKTSEETANSTKLLAWGTFGMVCATLLSAVVFAIMTNKSIRARSSEIHTSELKDLIIKWKSGLPTASYPTNPVMAPPEPVKYEFEEHRLFPDIPNHTPRELNIDGTWKEFKKQLDKYEETRYELFQAILHLSLEKTGLDYNPDLSKDKDGISQYFPRTIYEQLVTWAIDKEKKYSKLQCKPNESGDYIVYPEGSPGYPLFKVTKVSGKELCDKTMKVYNDMVGNPQKLLEQFSEKIDSILKTKERADDMRGRLVQMLDYLLSKPVYYEKCEH